MTIFTSYFTITKNKNFGLITLICCLLWTSVSAEKVALFYNDDYVQIDEGNLFAEGSNMLASLKSEGHEVVTFDEISAAELSLRLSQTDLLIIPELERKDLFADMDTEMIQILKEYVQNGGGLIICGVVAPNEANSANALKILNGVFGFKLEADAISLSGMSDLATTEATETTYSTTPNSIVNNNSIAFLTGGFPNGSKRVYHDTQNNNNTTVALLPFGDGEIAYLGWGWWNAAPNGAQDNGWLEVMNASITQVACTAPLAAAKNNLDFQLDEDGILQLDAADFDNGSFSCSEMFDYNITPKYFDCDKVGQQTVVFTITDNLGRTASKEVNINIKDDNGHCKSSALVTIAGKIVTEHGETISGVALDAEGSEHETVYTEDDGKYEIKDLAINQNYTVMPQKVEHPLNGLTTYDILLIGKHIIGIEEFDSPYKLIAADINKSGTITTADMVELRKMILFIQTDFNNNESWRFVKANHIFSNPTNPLVELLPESYNIENITESTTVDFVGIKVGDLNGSVKPNQFTNSTERGTNQILTLTTDELTMNKQELVTVDFKAKDIQALFGWQFSLDYDETMVEFVGYQSDVIETNDFAMHITDEGLMHISWAEPNKLELEENSTIFSLQFIAKETTQLSEVLTLNPRYLKAEAYLNNKEVADVELAFEPAQAITTTATTIDNNTFQVFQNYPNPVVDMTTIPFEIATASEVVLTIYDISGKEIHAQKGMYQAGKHEIPVYAQNLVNGMLIYEIATPNAAIAKRMMVVKQD